MLVINRSSLFKEVFENKEDIFNQISEEAHKIENHKNELNKALELVSLKYRALEEKIYNHIANTLNVNVDNIKYYMYIGTISDLVISCSQSVQFYASGGANPLFEYRKDIKALYDYFCTEQFQEDYKQFFLEWQAYNTEYKAIEMSLQELKNTKELEITNKILYQLYHYLMTNGILPYTNQTKLKAVLNGNARLKNDNVIFDLCKMWKGGFKNMSGVYNWIWHIEEDQQ